MLIKFRRWGTDFKYHVARPSRQQLLTVVWHTNRAKGTGSGQKNRESSKEKLTYLQSNQSVSAVPQDPQIQLDY